MTGDTPQRWITYFLVLVIVILSVALYGYLIGAWEVQP